ncbi:universal stress protein [Aurantivibrio infirmus]
MSQYKNIVVALDVSEESKQVLQHAVELAGGGSLHLVYVLRPLTTYYGSEIGVNFSSLQQELQKEAELMLEKIGGAENIPADHLHTLIGKPSTEIKRLAEELKADLIVIGTHGQHGLGLILGSTANGVLHGASCDVLAVKIKKS